ncbi:MAG: hypothetical protein NC321_02805 [Clostridium sp.]|nr:hypothetical protein [Clostridium sp.]
MDKVISRAAGLHTGTMAAVLFVVTFLFSALICYDGKSWGGDFSQYFAQTRALANHSIADWYEKNVFIINTSAEGIGSDVYPWFWSILLLPMYKLFGFHIPLLKLYEALYFAAAISCLVYILRRRMPGKPAFLICLGMTCNLSFLMYVNTIESDLPCMFMILLTINVIELYHQAFQNNDMLRKALLGILVGILIFASCETKTMNQALLLALFVYDVAVVGISAVKAFLTKEWVLRPRVCLYQGLVMALPFLSYMIAAGIFYSYLPKSGGTYYDYFEFTTSRVKANITGYFEILGQMVCATSRPLITVISYIGVAVLLFLAVVGMLCKWKKELYLSIYIGGMICMLGFYDYMGARFIFAIYALLMLFAYWGYLFLKEKWSRFRWGEWGERLIKDGYFMYMLLLLVSFCVVVFFIQTGRYTLRQTDSAEAEEFYAYINDNISDDAVVYFFKPRVLYFYTNVYSYNWYNDIDHMEDADYIAVCDEDGYDRVHAYAEEYGTLVYQNERFRLYEL